MNYQVTASFRSEEPGVPAWHGVLRLAVARATEESRKAYEARVAAVAREGFFVLAGQQPNVVIVTEENYSL